MGKGCGVNARAKLVALLSGACLVTGILSPLPVSAGSAPSSQGIHHPVKPRKYVTRPLKPNHLAVLQNKFRFHRGHKHYFSRHLYGPPGLLQDPCAEA